MASAENASVSRVSTEAQHTPRKLPRQASRWYALLPSNFWRNLLILLEARAGVEPTYTDLQSGA